MPAAPYLAQKYHNDFVVGITAKAMVGGDHCLRGLVSGMPWATAVAMGEAGAYDVRDGL